MTRPTDPQNFIRQGQMQSKLIISVMCKYVYLYLQTYTHMFLIVDYMELLFLGARVERL